MHKTRLIVANMSGKLGYLILLCDRSRMSIICTSTTFISGLVELGFAQNYFYYFRFLFREPIIVCVWIFIDLY